MERQRGETHVEGDDERRRRSRSLGVKKPVVVRGHEQTDDEDAEDWAGKSRADAEERVERSERGGKARDLSKESMGWLNA